MKYDYTGKTIEVNGKILRQIICTQKLKSVDVGDIGGYIEKDENLDGGPYKRWSMW